MPSRAGTGGYPGRPLPRPAARRATRPRTRRPCLAPAADARPRGWRRPRSRAPWPAPPGRPQGTDPQPRVRFGDSRQADREQRRDRHREQPGGQPRRRRRSPSRGRYRPRAACGGSSRAPAACRTRGLKESQPGQQLAEDEQADDGEQRGQQPQRDRLEVDRVFGVHRLGRQRVVLRDFPCARRLTARARRADRPLRAAAGAPPRRASGRSGARDRRRGWPIRSPCWCRSAGGIRRAPRRSRRCGT